MQTKTSVARLVYQKMKYGGSHFHFCVSMCNGTGPLVTRKHFEFIRVKAEPKRALVRPHVDQSKPISGIDLIALFIVVESGDIIQGFCYAAPNSRYLDSLRFAASATATGTAIAITHGNSIGCFYFG